MRDRKSSWPAYVEIGNVASSVLSAAVSSLPHLDDGRWVRQDTRGSRFLPIYGRVPGSSEARYARYVDDSIRSIADPLIDLCDPAPDVFVLYTPPGAEFPDHNDTGMFEITNHAPCWKLRVVMQGNPGCLYFINQEGCKVHIPSDANVYAINGTVPHGMDTDQAKLTLAIGWPWRGLNYAWIEYMFRHGKRTVFVDAVSSSEKMFESMDFKK